MIDKSTNMTEKNKMPENVEVEYQNMSLRHEHVENEKLPKINIFFKEGAKEHACQVGYGIEEEGLPYLLISSESPFEEAQKNITKKGLGVAIGIDQNKASVFNRQLKKEEAFLNYIGSDNEKLRILGKNGSRIIKRKPFILEE